jgi:sugar phosphate isomerase/epimerase
LSLCWGTVPNAGLLELVDAAAAASFDAVSITGQMYDDAGCTDAELARRLDDAGLFVSEVDPLLTWLPGQEPLPDGGPFGYGVDDMVRVATAVGASRINAAVPFAGKWSRAEITDAFGVAAGRAARDGVDLLLEFLPWTNVHDLATAAAVVRGCAVASAGVMVDVWHVHRGNSGLYDADLVTVSGIQLDDASPEPGADVVAETMSARLLPGEGVIPLAAMLPPLLAAAPEAVIGVEVFNRRHESMRAVEVAQNAARAARRTLASVADPG